MDTSWLIKEEVYQKSVVKQARNRNMRGNLWNKVA